MRVQHFICVALLALLSACGPPQPQYRTDIELVSPASNVGRMCANNCLLSQQNCQQSCSMQEQSCHHTSALEKQNAELRADRAYEDYVRQRTHQGKLIKKNREDFVYHDYHDCSVSECQGQCVSNFHICHTNCGGQVIPHTYCVANCNLIPAQQPAASVPPAGF